jgi:SAM-dependent methyltransferase
VPDDPSTPDIRDTPTPDVRGADGRPVTVARDETPRGSVALRRRTAGAGPATTVVTELITNGAFVMDSAETSTERLLARAALDRATLDRATLDRATLDRVRTEDLLDVVVAGLGLGFTLAEVLADRRVGTVDVVEIEPAVVDWVRDGLVPATSGVLADGRVRALVADIRDWLPDRPDGSVDILLLDVDNGPDFLVHQTNAQVYGTAFLGVVRRVLRPGGVIAVWSAERSDALRSRLRQTFGAADEIVRRVVRDGREIEYFLYVATVAAAS